MVNGLLTTSNQEMLAHLKKYATAGCGGSDFYELWQGANNIIVTCIYEQCVDFMKQKKNISQIINVYFQ